MSRKIIARSVVSTSARLVSDDERRARAAPTTTTTTAKTSGTQDRARTLQDCAHSCREPRERARNRRLERGSWRRGDGDDGGCMLRARAPAPNTKTSSPSRRLANRHTLKVARSARTRRTSTTASSGDERRRAASSGGDDDDGAKNGRRARARARQTLLAARARERERRAVTYATTRTVVAVC